MPFGTLKTKEVNGGIPLFSPPYEVVPDQFTDVDCLNIRYHTTYDAVKDLIPEELELTNEPMIYVALYSYGFSPIGAYGEFICSVEVKYKGDPYLFTILLVLNNEAAIFSGRERLGIPKVFGQINFKPSEVDPAAPPTGYVTGTVERPANHKLIQLGFRPRRKVQDLGPLSQPRPLLLHLRCIPASNQRDPPVVREFVATRMEMYKGEVWTGEGSVGLFDVSEFEPLHKLKVVRYVDATITRHGAFNLHEPEAVYSLL